MCGIIGYLAKGERTPERVVFDRAVDALTHRGPDRRGAWVEAGVGLGFRRLSIIDLATGDQPMSNEDGNLRIVFNGEIYNFAMLRDHLKAKGHHFQTKSDTETILHLYEEEGERCVDQLRGMFAFAIYDRRKKSLFLARDRFGKKPLVYAETATGFYFASEIGALLQLADVTRVADLPAIHAYLALHYTPGTRTAWRDIRRLPAASLLKVEQGRAGEPDSYWRLDWAQKLYEGISDAEAVETFRHRFEESVALRMVSDVPLGAFLSGGVDSSVTVAAMVQSGAKVKTFCIGFEDPRFDESLHAKEVASRLGTDHYDLPVEADSLASLDLLVDRLGEPFADQSLLPTYRLSQFAHERVTVALSGDGGDELFGGYKRYQHLAHAQLLGRLGLSVPWLLGSRLLFGIEKMVNPSRRKLAWPRSALDRILRLPPREQYLGLVGCWRENDLATLWKRGVDRSLPSRWIDSAMADHPGLSGLSRWQALDMETYLVDDIMRKVDTASMATSLECRCPLLDHHVAEFAAGLPDRLKIDSAGQTKALLRKAYPDLLPPEMFDRKKKGFSMPIGDWMRNQWKEPVRASVEDGWGGGMGECFDRNAVSRLWREHQEGREDHGERLWAWHVLRKWNEQFKPEWEGSC